MIKFALSKLGFLQWWNIAVMDISILKWKYSFFASRSGFLFALSRCVVYCWLIFSLFWYSLSFIYRSIVSWYELVVISNLRWMKCFSCGIHSHHKPCFHDFLSNWGLQALRKSADTYIPGLGMVVYLMLEEDGTEVDDDGWMQYFQNLPDNTRLILLLHLVLVNGGTCIQVRIISRLL